MFQTWFGYGEKGRLTVMNANGSGLRMLAVAYPASLWPDGRPAWSPNGRWIAFRRKNIVVVRADGRGERIVARCWGRCAVRRWSPDGEAILFGDDRYALAATVLVNVKSGRERVLVSGGGGSLSPDGRLIAFDRDGEISIMSADGRNKHLLTKGFHPVWSPDGAGLAFQRNDSIFTIRINGTAERLVAENVGVGYPWGRWPKRVDLSHSEEGCISSTRPPRARTQIPRTTSCALCAVCPSWSETSEGRSTLQRQRAGSTEARSASRGTRCATRRGASG